MRATVLAVLATAVSIAACTERVTSKDPTLVSQPPAPVVVAAPLPPVDAAPVAEPPVDAAPPAAPKPGYDFIADMQVLYRVVACGRPDSPIPELLTHGDPRRAARLQRIVDRHCKALQPFMDRYRDAYFAKARAWFVAHQPADLPTTVVYAFGGGDLTSALVAFPNATEITT
ncbi:MAG: hypothetical protein H0T79_00725, partial [Deltaproteobacteria bacterium]|nr:hypothetical protein [Deltaproteobacteria bacterium]